MLRPLTLDFVEFAMPILVGLTLFLLGWKYPRWPSAIRHVVVILTVSGVVFVALCLLRLFPFSIDPFLYYLGGPKQVLGTAALLLLGIAWKAPGRTFSPSFLNFLVGVAGLILVVEASGRLVWRFLAQESWSRNVDDQGCLAQSTVRTCGPAAAAMLLHHHGIAASEGELAYLARTSFFGTDGFALGQAVHHKVRGQNLAGIFQKTNYPTLLEKGLPFVATLRFRHLVAHAIFVKQMDEEGLTIIDPSKGYPARIARAEFEEEWNGDVVQVVPK